MASYNNVSNAELEEGSYDMTMNPVEGQNNKNGAEGVIRNQSYIRMATSTLHDSYKDAKKSTLDLAKEVQVECFEQWEIYESVNFLKENWYKFVFIPYLPAFHHPGWMLRYAVGPYNGELLKTFFQDFIAGITVALTLIPQALSYAGLANLPPVQGLYTAVITAAAYAFFGSSMQLCVGPVALVSLLTGEMINKYNIDYVNKPQDAIDFAGELALAVGVILVIMSLLNMGNLIRFISEPVMSGFTTGAACLIGVNQLKNAFGFGQSPTVPQQGQTGYDYNYQVFEWFTQNWNSRYPTTASTIKNGSANLLWRNPLATQICFGVYIPCVAIVILKGYIKPTEERKKTLWFNLWTVFASLTPFIAIVIAAHMAWQMKHDDGYADPKIKHDFYTSKLSIVGIVTPGLNFVKAPSFRWDFGKLLGDAIQVALIAYMESYGVAQRIAHQNHEFHLLSASQEIWSIGVANVIASCSSSYPVAGSFSRSSLNQVAGAKTPLSKIVNMIVVILALQYLTRTFQYIPQAALSAVIWVAIYNLVTVSDFWNAWKHSKKDFFVMLITLTFVFVFNTGIGLAIGMGASVFFYLFDQTFNEENAPKLIEPEVAKGEDVKDIKHVRLQQDITFLTSGRLLDTLTALTLIEPPKPDENSALWNDKVFYNVSSFFDYWLKPKVANPVTVLPKVVVLDLEVVRIMDITALHDVNEEAKNIRRKKVAFVIINATPVITKSLVKYGFFNDDLTGVVDEETAQHYNRLAGDEIPRRLPQIADEDVSSKDEEEGLQLVRLVDEKKDQI